MPQVTLGQLSDTRKNNFDFLRFFFASLVIFSHSYLLLLPDRTDVEPMWQATGQRMNFGTLAVTCFFGISGFLITQSWMRTKRVGDYAKKRILRIYPGWIVALLFCVFVVAPLLRPDHGLHLANRTTLDFFSQLVGHASGQLKLLPGIDGPVNGSTWTIPFEMACYVAAAVLGLCGLLRRPLLVLALTLVILFCSLWWPPQSLAHVFQPTQTPHIPYYRWSFLVDFLLGGSFYLYRDRIPHSPWLFALSLALVGLTLFGGPLAGLYFLLLPTAGFYALFYLAFLPLGRLHAWARHGDLSYGVYLYAYPLQRLLIAEQWRGDHLSPLTLFLAAWVLSCGAAALSWRFVERPFLKLKPQSAAPPAEDSGVPVVPGRQEQTA